MELHHHHHHHHEMTAAAGTALVVGIVMNLLFVFVEVAVGLAYNSLGLLSDAGHNLSDVFSLTLSLFAIRMAKRHGNIHFTYGYKKSTILVSLANAIILLVAVGAILIESIYKLRHPEEISGEAISWTAGVGIIVNGITALLLMKNQGHDLNVKGAFLHMAMDTLVSVGVVVSGIIITLTGFVIIDTLISLVIALIILASTWKLRTFEHQYETNREFTFRHSRIRGMASFACMGSQHNRKRSHRTCRNQGLKRHGKRKTGFETSIT